MARLQLDLSETSDALMDRIMELCELKTKKEAVENALMLLGWAAANVSEGHTIAAIDKDRKVFKEISSPALEGAAYHQQRVAKQAARKTVNGPRKQMAEA